MSGARPWLRSLRTRSATSASGGIEHAALARRQLLVGVEGEGGGVAARARPRTPSASTAPSAWQRVLEQAEAALGGERLERRHRRRVAEDVDRQESRGRAPPTAAARRRRIDVERHRVDVAEDGRRALVQQAVGRRDEAERGRHDLVAGAPAERADAEVERGVPLDDRDRVLDPEPAGEVALEALQHRPQREPPRAQHLEHQLLLARPELGPRERDRLAVAHSRASQRAARPPARAMPVGLAVAAGTRTRASRRAPPTRPR